MEKINYSSPELILISFDEADVIVTSSENPNITTPEDEII